MAYLPATGSVVAFQSDPTKFLGHTSVSGNVNVAGSVFAILGSSVYGNISGSVLAVVPQGTSVSGTVDIGVIPGSVVAFQGTIPWTVGSIYGNISGSVVATQGTTPWLIGSVYGNISGSVVASGTVTANQGTGFGSVAAHIKSGSVIAILGNTSVVAVASTTWPGSVFAILGSSVYGNISGSVAAIVTNKPSISGTVDIGVIPGSVVAFQGGTRITSVSGTVFVDVISSITATMAQGTSVSGTLETIIVGGSVASAGVANQSVSGTVDIGVVPGSVVAIILSKPSISGTVNIGTIPGSVIAFPSTTWPGSVFAILGSSVYGNISGSVAATISGTPTFLQLAGSILATSASISPPANQSVSGTVDIGIIPGSVVAFQGGAHTTSVVGTVAATQSGAWTTSVVGNVGQIGTVITSLVSTVPSSVLVGASIIGVTPVTLNATRPSISGTVLIGNTSTNVSGSVIAVILSKPSISGTVAATQQGTWATSIVGVGVIASIPGTYAEDAGHSTTNPGLFTLGVRNDAVASFTSANLDYTPFGLDSAGRTIIKPHAAEEARVEGYVSLTSTSVTTLVAAAGAGLKNYITDLWVANTGSVTTLVTLTSGGGASVLGYTIAPATGGSNLIGLATPIRTGANETFGVQAGAFTSTLYATCKGFKAP